MSERLFQTLADWLAHEPVVLASVTATRGATPRKPGARMLIAAERSSDTVGGGLAEARVLEAARALLASGEPQSAVAIDLGGGPQSAGICGGRMQIALRRWSGPTDRARAGVIATELRHGRPAELAGHEYGAETDTGTCTLLQPNPRLLIVGAGHCGLALYQMAKLLDFDIWVYDSRAELACAEHYPDAHCLSGPASVLASAGSSQRALLAVLLNRDFRSDVECLQALAPLPLCFIGMMGSRRRIAQVLAQLSPEHAQQLAHLQAPVGLQFGAETPHEIAVSILAHLIGSRVGHVARRAT